MERIQWSNLEVFKPSLSFFFLIKGAEASLPRTSYRKPQSHERNNKKNCHAWSWLWGSQSLALSLSHYRANESLELHGAEFENNWSSSQLNGPERVGIAWGHTAHHGRAGTRTWVFLPWEQHSFCYVTLKVLNNSVIIILRVIIHWASPKCPATCIHHVHSWTTNVR